MMRATILALALILPACTAFKPARVVEVSVPIPIACQEPVPDRPPLPIDDLSDMPDIFLSTRALIASVERLEGYAALLEVALSNCRAPVRQASYGLSGQFPP